MRLTWTDFQLSGLLANISKVVKKADPQRHQVRTTTNTDCHEFVQFPESNAFDRCRQIEQVLRHFPLGRKYNKRKIAQCTG